MLTFKDFFEASGMTDQDFSGMGREASMAQGRDIGEKFVRDQLRQYGVNIDLTNSFHQDAILKIDGYWNGKPIQIKVRRGGHENTVAYEILKNYNSRYSIEDQLKRPKQQGREWKGKAKYYFVLNKQETEIYLIDAQKLKILAQQAVRELDGEALTSEFKASTGVILVPVADRNPENYGVTLVRAYIPVNIVAEKTFPVKKNIPQQKQTPPTQASRMNQNWLAAMNQADQTGQSYFDVPNNLKMLKPFQKFAEKKGFKVVVQNGKVMLKKNYGLN